MGRPQDAGSGIEKLLERAAADPAVREALRRDRLAAADAAGIRLSASERRILSSIPDEQLDTTVAYVRPGARPGPPPEWVCHGIRPSIVRGARPSLPVGPGSGRRALALLVLLALFAGAVALVWWLFS